ncbi:MAG TPA: isocitrate lyase/phosphoenolpyruvate mutase family protein [Acidimicrobiales bacterium]|nr:isocitrate lyase/phosphoenolpyruvate mutase family protein [Acidimicrobiales bacterium]
MTTLTGKAAEFLALHKPGAPLLQPNAFDVGSARLLESMGFAAIATTSSGAAGTLGKLDGQMTRDEVLAHCAALSAAVSIPVAADYENGFADDPSEVADSVRLAAATGLAGLSIEDWSGDAIYERGLAVDRVAAAADAAHAGDAPLVLTARAENLIRGIDDLDDAIARAQAFQDAGADVIFVPGLRTLEQVRAVVSSVDAPVTVLVLGGAPSVAELAEAGVARISVGGSFMYSAYAAVVAAATELREHGTYGYWDAIAAGRDTIRSAFG